MGGHMPDLWAGIDAGKAHQHCLLIDDEGNRLLSRKVANDETALLKLITDVKVKAAVVLLTKYTTPAGIRRAGEARIVLDLHDESARLTGRSSRLTAAEAGGWAKLHVTRLRIPERRPLSEKWRSPGGVPTGQPAHLSSLGGNGPSRRRCRSSDEEPDYGA